MNSNGLNQVAIDIESSDEEEIYTNDLQVAAAVGKKLLKKIGHLENVVDEHDKTIDENEQKVLKLEKENNNLLKMYEDQEEEMTMLEERIETMLKHVDMLKMKTEYEVNNSLKLDDYRDMLEKDIEKSEMQEKFLEDKVAVLSMDIKMCKLKFTQLEEEEESDTKVLSIEPTHDFRYYSAWEAGIMENPIRIQRDMVVKDIRESNKMIKDDLFCQLENSKIIIKQLEDAVIKQESLNDNYSSLDTSSVHCSCANNNKSILEEIEEADKVLQFFWEEYNKFANISEAKFPSAMPEIDLHADLIGKYDKLLRGTNRTNVSSQTEERYLLNSSAKVSEDGCIQFFLEKGTMADATPISANGRSNNNICIFGTQIQSETLNTSNELLSAKIRKRKMKREKNKMTNSIIVSSLFNYESYRDKKFTMRR